MNKDQIVLFDGVCKLCNSWSQFLIKHDQDFKFKLCSMQSETGRRILNQLGMKTDTFETMVLVKSNTVYTKSDAFLEVVAQLNPPWLYLAILRSLNKSFRDWFYDRIALNRYTLFGKHDHCSLPSRQDQKRFLD